jgi:hypothetical protein
MRVHFNKLSARGRIGAIQWHQAKPQQGTHSNQLPYISRAVCFAGSNTFVLVEQSSHGKPAGLAVVEPESNGKPGKIVPVAFFWIATVYVSAAGVGYPVVLIASPGYPHGLFSFVGKQFVGVGICIAHIVQIVAEYLGMPELHANIQVAINLPFNAETIRYAHLRKVVRFAIGKLG